MTRPRWPGAVAPRVFFPPLPWRWYRSVLLRPTISCCTETCAASTDSGSAEWWQTASAIMPAAIQPAAKVSSAMLRTASASRSIQFDAHFSADRPPPLCFMAALRRLQKLFISMPLQKCVLEATVLVACVHGTVRYYACMYLSVVCVAHPPDLCHSCYIGPRTWTGQQYCIRCLIHPGSWHLISFYVRTH
mgnify:CR=1 FL=1